MAKKKREIVTIARRAVEPAVQVVQKTRTKLSRGQPRLSGAQIMSAIGGAVAGGVASHFVARAGLGRGVVGLGVAGLGGIGAYMLDGKAQAAAVGAAALGVVNAATAMMDTVTPAARTAADMITHPTLPRPVPTPAPLPAPGAGAPRRQAALPPADVQAAFEAARRQLRRQGGDWTGYEPYAFAYEVAY